MSIEAQVADEIVQIGLRGSTETIKIIGKGAKHLAALLLAAMKDVQILTGGQTSYRKLEKLGSEIVVFDMKKDDAEYLAKVLRSNYHGVQVAIVQEKSKQGTDLVTICAQAKHASVINHIIQSNRLSTLDLDATITPELDRPKGETKQEPQKEGNTHKNPTAAKTATPRLSEPSLKQENRSARGASNRKSVRRELAAIRDERKADLSILPVPERSTVGKER